MKFSRTSTLNAMLCVTTALLAVAPSAVLAQSWGGDDQEITKSAKRGSLFAGVLTIFSPKSAPAAGVASDVATNAMPTLSLESRPQLPVAIGNDRVENSDQTTIRIEAEDIVPLEKSQFETAELVLNENTDVKSTSSKLRSLLGFGAAKPVVSEGKSIAIPVLPDNTELVTELKQMKSAHLKKFFEIQQGGLRKIAELALRANVPANDITSLLAHSNSFMFKSAKQITTGAAWSWGFDVLVYGGPSAGKLGRKVLMGMITKAAGGESKVTRAVARVLEKGDSLMFQGTLGFNVIYTTDASGYKRTFLQLVTSGDRSRSILTTTGVAGYDLRLVLNTFDKGSIDPKKGRVGPLQTKTSTLGVAGAMSTADGVSTLAVNIPIPIIGGMALVPLVGSVAVYESAGQRHSLLTVNLTALQDNAMTKAVSSAYRFARDLVPTKTKANSCSALFLN